MSDIKTLMSKRKTLRKRITQLFEVRAQFVNLDPLEIKENLDLVQTYGEEQIDLDDRIHDLLVDAPEGEEAPEISDEELDRCREYKDRISRVTTALLACVPPEVNHIPVRENDRNPEPRSILRSPVAPLPRFTSADGEDLTRFFIEFEDTIGKYTYSQYDKLLLLKQQLSGRALTLVNSLESNRQGYLFAKDLLVEALASDEIQIFNTIRQISELKLSLKADPFEYISKVRLLSENVRKLKIDVDHFMQYFVWLGLNESFQEQVIHITNKIRPNFDEIMKNYFTASERYCLVQKKSKVDKLTELSRPVSNELNSFATNVNYGSSNGFRSRDVKKFRQCNLCPIPENSQPTHPMYKCEKYADSKSKLRRLSELNGCSKCGYTNHQVATCRYKFAQKCRYCKDWHQSFLCPGEREVGRANVRVKNANSYSVVISDVYPGTTSNDSILPTFSFNIHETVVRGLKDCGSQANFIKQSLADKLKLKVVMDNVDLRLKGINIIQRYKSKIVEVGAKFGDTSYTIEAITIPKIDISLKFSCLGEIVRTLNSSKVKLADGFLSAFDDNIDDLQFILGTKSAFCLPECDVVIGDEIKSLYSNSPCGVLLQGDASELLVNVRNHFTTQSDSSSCDESVPLCSYSSAVSTNDFEFSNTDDPDGFIVMDNGKVLLPELKKATNSVLSEYCGYFTNYDQIQSNDVDSELNDSLVKQALDNLTINSDNRIVMPLFWNAKVSHLLGNNRGLAEAVLKSNLKKMQKDEKLLLLMDETFRDQEASGIIERIDDFDTFASENPNHSFIAHMGVYKPNHESTKCRIVYLSNLCQKLSNQKLTVSHNQAIHSGPNLNQKLSSAILHLRFDPLLLCFDIAKAFNCIGLNEVDQNRLLLLWFRNVKKGDYTIVPFKHVRLSFGVRCSPAILMLSLYYMLVLNVDRDDSETRKMKALIYQLSYMDNLAVTASSYEEMNSFYNSLSSIFGEFGFPLQQFISNCPEIQSKIDEEFSVNTDSTVKLLGLNWNRAKDTLSTKPINLNSRAQNKREILSSIATQFDIYNYNGPLLNRARIFLHELQCDKSISWDDKLPVHQLREWGNICRQANSSPLIEMNRFVGSRNSRYKLVAFSDSSKSIYGVVVYILDLDTNKLSFLMAKNRIVNTQMESKSIPSLEMQGIVLATECLVDLRRELSGDQCMYPINIGEMVVYSDSLVCLSWINAHTAKFDKLQKRSVFVQNRLVRIAKLCENFPITYTFVSGLENPSDCMTRCLSYKKLMQTSFINGPSFVYDADSTLSRDDIFTVTVPNPEVNNEIPVQVMSSVVSDYDLNYSLNLDKISSFTRLRSIYSKVMIFVNKLKMRVSSDNVKPSQYNFFKEATDFLILSDQRNHYGDLFTYFDARSDRMRDIPSLVSKLNIFIDNRGLLRVKSKFGRMTDGKLAIFPILMSKTSKLTELFVRYFHIKMSHSGICNILNELRMLVWIPHCYSVVKRVLKRCTICKRFKTHPLILNQSPYRENRLNPSQIPYRYVYMDYFGPYNVKMGKQRSKVYVLCITCMYTRAINLKVCTDLSVNELLRSFQMHNFEFGVPTSVITDLGTQFVAGASIIKDFLRDASSYKYFEENNVTPIVFDQYPKGNSSLGSLVESCVKLTKRLIYGAIHKNVLPFRDFEFFVAQTVSIVNKRPIAFKSSLRDSNTDEFLNVITPENLLKGHNMLSINLIPSLQPDSDEKDPDWSNYDRIDSARECSKGLRKARESLLQKYHRDFLAKLIDQAVDVNDRYRPVKHDGLKINDIVLIKEPLTKITNYPMGIVRSITTNVNGEITGATVMKGGTREVVKRHSSTLIPLLSSDDTVSDVAAGPNPDSDISYKSAEISLKRPQRKAASLCKTRMSEQLS